MAAQIIIVAVISLMNETKLLTEFFQGLFVTGQYAVSTTHLVPLRRVKVAYYSYGGLQQPNSFQKCSKILHLLTFCPYRVLAQTRGGIYSLPRVYV